MRGQTLRFSKTLALMAVSLLVLAQYMLPIAKGQQNKEIIGNVGIYSDSSFEAPDWVKNAVFYQIFPDRFRDGNTGNNAWGDGASGDILWKNSGDWPSIVYAANRTWGEYPYLGAPYGRDWFGGDLQGVQEKASYLADLGITSIWFNPIMDSTDNHGYNGYRLQVDKSVFRC